MREPGKHPNSSLHTFICAVAPPRTHTPFPFLPLPFYIHGPGFHLLTDRAMQAQGGCSFGTSLWLNGLASHTHPHRERGRGLSSEGGHNEQGQEGAELPHGKDQGIHLHRLGPGTAGCRKPEQ